MNHCVLSKRPIVNEPIYALFGINYDIPIIQKQGMAFLFIRDHQKIIMKQDAGYQIFASFQQGGHIATEIIAIE